MHPIYRSRSTQTALTCIALLSGCAASEPIADETVEAAAEPLTIAAPEGIVDVQANGTGCPAGTWSAAIAEDGSGFDMEFYAYEASVTPSSTVDVTDCMLTVSLQSPSGLSYAVESFSYDGHATLDDGVQGRFIASYYFQGDPSGAAEAVSELTGPKDEPFAYRDNVRIADVVWSPCGKERHLNVKTTMRVANNSDNPGNGTMTLGSASGSHSNRLTFKLVWQRCN